MGNSAGSEVTHLPMAAEINRCRLGPEQGPSADGGGPTSQEATSDGASAAETTTADMTDSVQSEILIPGTLTSTPMQTPQVQTMR